jgi:integrase/recombinase XerD
LCSLTCADHDLIGGCFTVLGKGGKRRALHYSKETQRLVRGYLRTLPKDWGPDDPLFPGQRGGHMSRSGLLQLFERLARRAGIQGYRRSPHCCRHTFAVEFLQSGGSVFALQQILGHEDLSITRKYCSLAANDVVKDARKHSLVDRLTRRERR